MDRKEGVPVLDKARHPRVVPVEVIAPLSQEHAHHHVP